MKTIKYLFLGLFMAAFTACIVSSCHKDDDDESNQSIEGYWYCDLDTEEPEMMAFRGGQFVYISPIVPRGSMTASKAKQLCDEALNTHRAPSGVRSDDVEFGTYSIKGSTLTIKWEDNSLNTFKYSISGNKLYMQSTEEGRDDLDLVYIRNTSK